MIKGLLHTAGTKLVNEEKTSAASSTMDVDLPRIRTDTMSSSSASETMAPRRRPTSDDTTQKANQLLEEGDRAVAQRTFQTKSEENDEEETF